MGPSGALRILGAGTAAPRRAARAPLRALAALALGVAAVHGWLLRGHQPPLLPGTPPPVVTVRVVQAAPPVAPPGGGAEQTSPPVRQPTAARERPAAPATPRRPNPPEQAAAQVPLPVPGPAAPAVAPVLPVPAVQVPGAVAWPAPAHWRYAVQGSVRGVPLQGEGELRWDHDGQRYAATLRWALPGRPPREQRSDGLLGPQGLLPVRFADRLRSEEATHFDHGAGRITFSSNRPQAALLAGAQDRLGVLLQLAGLVAGEPARYTPGTAIAVQVATTREAAVWTFEVDGPQALVLPGGTVQALRLSRTPPGPHDLRIALWLAPGADYAPVRVCLTTAAGDRVDLQWSGTDKR